MQYSNGFKARMVRRMVGPEAISATTLAKEVGVSQATLSRWLRDAPTVGSVGGGQRKREGGSKSPRRWSAEEKLRVLNEASSLSGEELGAFLRSEGLHTAQLDEWRKLAAEALTGSRKRAGTSPEARRIKELERELLRKDRALAEVTALLALKKKPRRSGGAGTTTRPRRARPDPRPGRRGCRDWCPTEQGLRDSGHRRADGPALEAPGSR